MTPAGALAPQYDNPKRFDRGSGYRAETDTDKDIPYG